MVNMKKAIFLVIFSLWSLPFIYAVSGDTLPDAKVVILLETLKQAKGIERGKIYLELTSHYWRTNPKQSKIYAFKALNLLKDGTPVNLANAYDNLAVACHYLGQADSCIYYSNKIIEFDNTDNLLKYKGDAFNYIGLSYRRKGDLDKALQNGLKSLKIRVKIKDSVGIAWAYESLAMVYKYKGAYDKAIAMYQEAAGIFEKINDSDNLAGCYYNVADLYMDLKRYQLSKKYYLQAKIIIRETDELLETDINNSLGVMYYYTQKLDSALLYYQMALDGYKKLGSKEGVAIGYQNVGEVFVLKGLHKQGIKKLQKALKIYKELNYKKDIISVYLSLAQSFKITKEMDSAFYYLNKAYNSAHSLQSPHYKTKVLDSLYHYSLLKKDTVTAFKYYNKLIKFKDSVQLNETRLKVTELEEKYQNEKKQKRIEQLESKRKLDKAHFRILLISAFSLILLLLIGAYVIVQKRKKQKEIAELELEKSRIRSQSLAEQLELKNKQLTTHALNMMQKNKLLTAFGNNITDISREAEGGTKTKLKRLKMEVNHLLDSDKDWDTFKIYFEQINKDFLKKLKEINPDLTQTDIRLATLLKLNMTNKEIGSILNITHQSVKNAQYRLKSKLSLDGDMDVRDFVSTL